MVRLDARASGPVGGLGPVHPPGQGFGRLWPRVRRGVRWLVVMTAVVDLHFLGRPAVIGTAVLTGPEGVVLIDPGPSTTIEALRRGLSALGVSMTDVRALLLTHIHLDHCGGTGTLVAAHPHLEVYVHERGAPHLADPTKLVASATRLYGDRMEELWGAIEPVPADRLRPLGERNDLRIGGRALESIWTPGHANHHVCYLDSAAMTAYTGDTVGMCRPGHPDVVPPALPPEVDLLAWRASTDRLLAWQPTAFFVTHFGLQSDPAAHVDRFWRRLDDWSARVRASLDEPGTDESHAAAFAAAATADLARTSTPENAAAHALAAPFELCWYGLARYWRKRPAATS
jgi:glyoxylase-like metal-dependent hydrolase (beta-lactamase superfamily II)